MNRLFITLYTAVLIAIITAVAAATGILWLQWQPAYNHQLHRFTHATLRQVRADLRDETSNKSESAYRIQLRGKHGELLTYTHSELKRLRSLTAELREQLALIYLKDLSLSQEEKELLDSDKIIFKTNGKQRFSYLLYDQERVLEIDHSEGMSYQWTSELAFLMNRSGGSFQEILSLYPSRIFEEETPQVKTLSEHNLTRIELSRLLVAPRTSTNLISTKHHVRFLYLPSHLDSKSAHNAGLHRDPQLVEFTIFFSATLLPPIILLPLLTLFVGFALWIKLNPIARQACLLAQVAQEFGEGDLNARVRLEGGGPIEQVANQFDQAADQILALIKTQEALLQAVSHELRTPISRIYFLVDMLRDESDPHEREQLLRDTKTNLEELTSLTDELLKYKSYQQGEFNLSRSLCDISYFIRELLRQSVEISSTILLCDLTDKTLKVSIEEKALARAINNVIQNASRHAQSHVEVTLRHFIGEVGSLGGGEWLDLWIEDDGAGIPIELREHVFDPFMRVDQSRNRESGGVGLGLTIARTVLRALDGEVLIEDSELGGARLRLLLPVYHERTTRIASV